jgi:hypothetical protein
MSSFLRFWGKIQCFRDEADCGLRTHLREIAKILCIPERKFLAFWGAKWIINENSLWGV